MSDAMTAPPLRDDERAVLTKAGADPDQTEMVARDMRLRTVAIMPTGQSATLWGSAGFGWWIDDATGEPTVVDALDSWEAAFSMPTWPPDLWAKLVDRLGGWADRQVPLSVVHCPPHTLLHDGRRPALLPGRPFETPVGHGGAA